MTDERSLRAGFHDLGTAMPPEPEDRLALVSARAGAVRRRRRLAGSAAAAAVVAGAAAGWAPLAPGRPAVDRLTPAAPPSLSLDLDLRPGTPAQLVARLHGTGSPGLRYGWQVRWGDGSEDRAYGSSSCPVTSPGRVDDLRSYSHVYPRAGSYRVQVRITLCGVQQVLQTADLVLGRAGS